MSASDIMLASSRISSDPALDRQRAERLAAGLGGGRGTGPCCRRGSRPRRRARCAAVWEVVSPITSPIPASCHSRAISATVRVLPDPAGPASTSARRAEVSTRNAAAAWSRRSPEPVASVTAPRIGALRLELRLQLRLIRAEQPRRGRGVQARGAGLLRVREQPVLQRELRAGGVAARTVRDVHALARGAAQAIGHARPFRRGQHDRLGGQGLARQSGQQSGGVPLRSSRRALRAGARRGGGSGRLRSRWLGRLHSSHSFLHNGQRACTSVSAALGA